MKLPPLNALRAFEAAARHGGFIGAAEELCVTRGAISRQVKLLEDHLGISLFVRQAQGVRLTSAGKQLLPTLSEAFESIALETWRITRGSTDLRIICPPATSIRWLLPRLDEFRELHPEIQVRLTTDFHANLGFEPAEYDIGFSVENWPKRSPDLHIQTLFPVLLTPACSPGYLSSHPLKSPAELSGCNLLHETPKRADWSAWIDAFVSHDVHIPNGQDFPNLDMAVKAAVMGAGIVMSDLVLCRDEFKTGALIAPFPDMTCPSPLGGVCLIADCKQWHAPKVEAFRAWAQDAGIKDSL